MTSRFAARAGLAALLAFAALGAATVPAFELTDTQGRRHRLEDYRGKWVVVNYWATWCTPCIHEIPDIAKFARANRDKVVLGIALDAQDVEKTTKFAARVGHDYPLVLATESVEKQFAPVKGLPTTRIYDPSGKLVYDRPGKVTEKSLGEATAAK